MKQNYFNSRERCNLTTRFLITNFSIGKKLNHFPLVGTLVYFYFSGYFVNETTDNKNNFY